MDISELKQLMKNEATVVVVDEGKPVFVVLDYVYYKKMSGMTSENVRPAQQPSRAFHQDQGGLFGQREQERNQELLEKLNKEILALKSQIADEEADKQELNID